MDSARPPVGNFRPSGPFARRTLIRKTSLSSDRSDGVRSSSRQGNANTRTSCDAGCHDCPEIAHRPPRPAPCGTSRHDRLSERSYLFTMSDITRAQWATGQDMPEGVTTDAKRMFLCERAETPAWWSQTGSNRRPPACKAGALPTELWPRTSQRIDAQLARSDTPDANNGGPGKT